MAKVLVVFGAGASYGSDTKNLSKTPPLGVHLFEKLSQYNPKGWGQLDRDLAQEFKDDFEKGMERLAHDQPGNLPILQRAMAEYFFSFIPTETNLYYVLATKLKSSQCDIAFATLNYERMLEISLSKAGYQPYVGPIGEELTAPMEICIPHGYCNLFCTSVAANPSTTFIDCKVDGPVKIISDPELFKAEIQGNAVPPVMSYYMPSKETMSGTSFIEAQRLKFRELTSDAETIAIVGVEVRASDQHIWDPISESSAKLVYLSGATGAIGFKKWSDEHAGDRDVVILKKFFEEGLEDLYKNLHIPN